MMFKSFLIFLSLYVFLVACDNPSFDYCALQSEKCVKHVACENNGLIDTSKQLNFTLQPIPNALKIKFLDAFNQKKNNIAKGLTLIPQGANVNVLTWSDELERLARNYLQVYGNNIAEIKHCVDSESFEFTDRESYILTSKDPEQIIQQMFDDTDIFHENDENDLRRLTHLQGGACYFVTAPEVTDKFLVMVCLLGYNVKENLVRTVYEEGEPCSKCVNGGECDSVYTGLCK